ncbi:MAG: DUF454 domain-containing protein [Sulfurovum sp.]|nr:DUF454 domain-containing protein [Sulfurovum sp.]
MRYIWFVFGFISIAFAILGMFLPLLPTVPFLLLAAFFFAKSSEKIHQWLLEHKIFGGMIEDWQERGAISMRSKYIATISMAVVLTVSVVFDFGIFVILVQMVVMSLVLIFIWTRPNE